MTESPERQLLRRCRDVLNVPDDETELDIMLDIDALLAQPESGEVVWRVIGADLHGPWVFNAEQGEDEAREYARKFGGTLERVYVTRWEAV